MQNSISLFLAESFDNRRITAAGMKIFRITAGYSFLDNQRNESIPKEVSLTPYNKIGYDAV